jgi:hypothetical protein
MLSFPWTFTSSRALDSTAIPYYEHVVSAVLSRGVVSVSDAHRATPAGAASGKCVDHIARDRRPESSALFAVFGGVGTGKTTLLLLGAHNRRVRCQFHYNLVLVLGKVAT